MIKPFRFTLIALCLLILNSAVFAKKNEQSLDKIAAIVNDTPIAQSEVTAATNTVKAQMRNSNIPLPPETVLQKKMLEQVIDRKLQLQAAEQAGIKITDKQIDQTIDNIAKENGVTADVLYSKVETQNLTRSEYRKEIREELLLQQIQQQQVASRVMMNREEVKNFMQSKEWQKATVQETTPAMKEYHVEDLVILLPDGANAEAIANAKTAAQALFTQAKQGASYNSLIKPNDKTMENNDLGWRKLDEIPSAFMNQVANAEKGSVMEPVQTGNGFHILHLVDARQFKNPAANATPLPTEKEAQEMVYQRKFAEALKKWVAKLHSQAVINLHPDSMV